jgi:hypothetical protein
MGRVFDILKNRWFWVFDFKNQNKTTVMFQIFEKQNKKYQNQFAWIGHPNVFHLHMESGSTKPLFKCACPILWWIHLHPPTIEWNGVEWLTHQTSIILDV